MSQSESPPGGSEPSLLEFLTTYGWAFLVILIMIGALAYFGVFDSFLKGDYDVEEDQCTLYACNYTNEYANLLIYRDACPQEQSIATKTTQGNLITEVLEPQQHSCIEWN